MEPKPLTPDGLIREVNLSRYISKETECKEMIDKCREVFVSQQKATDRLVQVERALDFIKTVWRKYDCEDVAELYDKFVKIEEALFGLERDKEAGGRYRDHFIHMVNCFVFGLRIIESLISQIPEDKAKELFKVDKENLKDAGLPFSGDYQYHERLFYLWTLISTFHDIAIPFQHLARLGRGISNFVEEFGWVFTDPSVSMLNFDSSQLHYYFDLLGGIYGGRLATVDQARKYRRPEGKQYYLAKLLGREFDRRNHGVLSGFFMWKTVEEIFLVGRSEKYRDRFGIEEFDRYAEYVLEQDVARAALAISLHAIGEDAKSRVYAKVFPVDFASYPLTFLLILSDELEEYLRWEGTTLRKEVNIARHPAIDVSLDPKDNSVSASVSLLLAKDGDSAIIDWAKQRAAYSQCSEPIADLNNAAHFLGESMKKILERKLKLGENFRLKLSLCQEGCATKPLYSKNLNSAG